MERVHVHIGAHKTGSTLLQTVLREVAPQLERLSVRYSPDDGHLLSELMTASTSGPKRLEEIRAELIGRWASSGAKRVLVSHEALFGKAGSGYENIGEIARDLATVLDGFDVTIVSFTRRQDAFIESYYVQLIKQGGTQSFEEFCNDFDVDAYRWDALLERYEGTFGAGKLRVLPYEAVSGETSSFVQTFFAAMGIHLRIDGEWVSNPSYSLKGLEIARRCNALLTPEEQVTMREFLQRQFPKAPGEEFGLFNPEQRTALLDGYRESNLALFEKYIQDHPADLYVP